MKSVNILNPKSQPVVSLLPRDKIELASKNLTEACTMLAAIRHLSAPEMSDDDSGYVAVAIQALAEKAGYICDRLQGILRGDGSSVGVIGDFDDWAGLQFTHASKAV